MSDHDSPAARVAHHRGDGKEYAVDWDEDATVDPVITPTGMLSRK